MGSKNANLSISKECIGCGSCMGFGYPFLQQEADGTISVKEGTFLGKDSEEYRQLEALCPAGAFHIDDSINIEDKGAITRKLLNALRQCNGIAEPTTKDLIFEAKNYPIPRPYPSGQYDYIYNSARAAEAAAQREFESKMFSQIDGYILKVITQYRVDKVKKYYTASLEEGSVYAQYNQKVSDLLKQINRHLGNIFPDSFCEINVMPNRDQTWKWLNKGELVADNLISSVRSEFNYSASDYSYKWDTDDTERPDGTDWRGRMKFRDKYCYRGVENAIEEAISDLRRACDYASDSIERNALDAVQWLVSVYNKELKKVLDEKIAQIESRIG